MGKRYYCDYCDRSFKDDFDARKKHVSGSMHMRMRMEHYNAFQDAETILAKESAKITCKRFMHSGECPFGASCKFTHYSPQELAQLRCQIEEEKKLKELKLESVPTVIPSTYQKGLAMNKDQCVGLSNASETSVPKPFPQWQVSRDFQNYHNLPASLKPINFQSYGAIKFEEWG